MQRSKRLMSRTGLAPMSAKRRNAFEAAGFAVVSTFRPRARASNTPPARPKARPSMSTGPDAATVEMVLVRDGYSCTSCGDGIGDIRGVDWSIQHRVARGAGGTSRPELNLAAALIVLCGSATDGCHGRVERRGRDDLHAGYWLLRDTNGKPTDPATFPVRHALHGWVLLGNDGTATATTAPTTGSRA
jgi:hypothetical protein